MIVLENREKYKDNQVVSTLLDLFEKAHREQNGLGMAIVLRKLRHHNVRVEISSVGINQPPPPQPGSEIRCPVMDI